MTLYDEFAAELKNLSLSANPAVDVLIRRIIARSYEKGWHQAWEEFHRP